MKGMNRNISLTSLMAKAKRNKVNSKKTRDLREKQRNESIKAAMARNGHIHNDFTK